MVKNVGTWMPLGDKQKSEILLQARYQPVSFLCRYTCKNLASCNRLSQVALEFLGKIVNKLGTSCEQLLTALLIFEMHQT